jgi:hypothetical protein
MEKLHFSPQATETSFSAIEGCMISAGDSGSEVLYLLTLADFSCCYHQL